MKVSSDRLLSLQDPFDLCAAIIEHQHSFLIQAWGSPWHTEGVYFYKQDIEYFTLQPSQIPKLRTAASTSLLGHGHMRARVLQ